MLGLVLQTLARVCAVQLVFSSEDALFDVSCILGCQDSEGVGGDMIADGVDRRSCGLIPLRLQMTARGQFAQNTSGSQD